MQHYHDDSSSELDTDEEIELLNELKDLNIDDSPITRLDSSLIIYTPEEVYELEINKEIINKLINNNIKSILLDLYSIPRIDNKNN